jgi:glutaredoxin
MVWSPTEGLFMSNMLSHNVHVLGSVATSSLTAWRGCLVVKNVPQPEKPIVLYDMEGCPYCRRVREALTALNLDVDIRPCPKGGSVFRAQAEALGGRQQFPLLADQNTGTVMYESEEIIEYLFRQYADRPVPSYYRGRVWQPVLGSVASVTSAMRGLRVSSGKRPEQPLHLWSFEGSPFSRLVR